MSLGLEYCGLVAGALDHHDEVIFLRAQHHLILLSPQPQEGEFVGGVQIQYHLARLLPHRLHQCRVVECQSVVQGRFDGNAVVIHHNYAGDVLHGLKSLQ